MCGSPPSAPQLPQYPNLTSQEQQLLTQQGLSVNQLQQLIQGVGGQLSANRGILQQVSGLYDQNGNINPTAAAQLQQQTQNALQAQGSAGTSAVNYINSLYGQGGVAQAQAQAYQQALTQGAPANQQIAFQQKQSFQAMQEQAAQQGIQINGTDWNSATSDSTAGQRLIQNFQQNANIQNQNYQLGYLGQAAQNISSLGFGTSMTGNMGGNLLGTATQTPLQYVGQSISGGPSALAPYLTQYQNSLQSLYQPYYMQQIGPYQQQMAQQQANYQAGLTQYNAGQNQMMGWGSLAAQLGSSALMAYGMRTPPNV